MKKFRNWLIREGFMNPSSLKEARELFNFPVKLSKQKRSPLWIINHLEKM